MRSLAYGLALLAAPLAAQSATPLVEPFRPNRAPLAATAEVPAGFELFVGDAASQALFNPARLGLNAQRGHRRRSKGDRDRPAGSFIYGTVRPSAVVTATAVGVRLSPPPVYPFSGGTVYVPSRQAIYAPNAVSVAAAFGNDALRWVVTAEHQAYLDRQEGDRNEQYQETIPLFSNQSRAAAELDYHQARARVAAVGQAGDVGYSVGVFGGYRLVHREVSSFSFIRQDQFSEAPSPAYSFSERERTTDLEGLDESFGVGAEFGIASKRLDLVGEFSFQRRRVRGAYASDQSEISESANVYQDTLFVRRTIQSTEQQGQAGFEANAFDGSLFAALHLGDGAEADAVTLEAFGTIGGGPAASTAASLYLSQRFEGPEGALELENEVRGPFDGAASDLDADGYHVGGAVGYVHRRRIGRTYVVAGARLAAAGGRRRDAPPLSDSPESYPYPYRPFPSVIEDERTDTFAAAATLPLYAEAPLVGPLRLFGGGVFSYGAAYFKERYDTRYGTLSPEAGEARESDRDERRQFTSDGRFYLGTRLRTRSGLAAQAAFRGSLSSFAGWTVSLGYHF